MNPAAPTSPDWIHLSRELKAIAEAGLRYSKDVFDIERFQQLHQLASLPMKAAVPDFKWPQEIGYATPKVDVRAAVIDAENQILLVREAASGLWTLPGGWADLNSSPAENAVKEVREESGLIVEAVKLIACWDKDKQGHPRQPEHVYKLVFLCHQTGGSLMTNHETSGAEFFSRENLPPLCPYRAATHYLDLAWQHAANPALATSFD